MKNQNGFSLIEIIIVITTLGILTSIAIPNLLSSQKSANEASTVSTLRTIHTAQTTFLTTVGGGNFGSRIQLGNANLIDSTLVAGQKNRYNFSDITIVAKSTTTPAYYYINATPSVTSGVGQSGYNSYAVTESGIVHRRVGIVAPTINTTTRLYLTGAPIQ